MGHEVGARADLVIVTTDNPRSEDPLAIANAIAKGAEKGRARVHQVPDRRAAIAQALVAGARDRRCARGRQGARTRTDHRTRDSPVL